MGGSSKIRSLAQVQPEGFLYTHLFSFHGFSQLNGKKKSDQNLRVKANRTIHFFVPPSLWKSDHQEKEPRTLTEL